MEQELRYGLDLGRLAVLKERVWVNEQLLRVVISCFQGKKKLNIFLKTSVRTKKLHKMKLDFLFFSRNLKNMYILG